MIRLYNAATNSAHRHLYTVPNGTHNDTWQQAGAEYFLVSIGREMGQKID